MNIYTVVGIWTDSSQRFCDWFHAQNPDEAESLCQARHPGLLICAVFSGTHEPVESPPSK